MRALTQCEPNCKIEKWLVSGQEQDRNAEFQLGLFAIRDIAAGEELSYNYGTSCVSHRLVRVQGGRRRARRQGRRRRKMLLRRTELHRRPGAGAQGEARVRGRRAHGADPPGIVHRKLAVAGTHIAHAPRHGGRHLSLIHITEPTRRS